MTSAQVNPQSSVTRKTDAGGEEALRSKHGMALDVGNHSGTKCACKCLYNLECLAKRLEHRDLPSIAVNLSRKCSNP